MPLPRNLLVQPCVGRPTDAERREWTEDGPVAAVRRARPHKAAGVWSYALMFDRTSATVFGRASRDARMVI
jgi:hypothetical protein